MFHGNFSEFFSNTNCSKEDKIQGLTFSGRQCEKTQRLP